MNHPQRLEATYRILSGDDGDERACEAIPDSACTNLPKNYLLNVGNGACTKLAEQIGGPNLVLPWLLGALGTPATLIGLLMPVKQLASLAPQLFISGRIRRVARRKRVWVASGLIQALCMLLIAAAAALLSPLAAGVVVVGLLIVFSAASGAASVAFQDVTAKTVPKGRRGRLLSNRAFIGGTLTVIAGVVLQTRLGGDADVAIYLLLLIATAGLWALSALAFAGIREQPGATDGGRNPGEELAEGLSLLRANPGYRRYVQVRALLLSVEVAMPFYALYGQSLFDNGIGALGLFIIAVGAGNVLSSPIWGRFSDRSSRRVLAISGVLGAATAALALIIGILPDGLRAAWLFGLIFVLLGITEQGVRLGRKTYLVDAAPADRRPVMVAFSNTAVGLLALAAALIGLLADYAGAGLAVALLGALALSGALAAARLPEAEVMMSQSTGEGATDG